MSSIADRYFALWNERDAEVRASLIAELWVDEAMYVDPMFEVTGHDALSKMVETAQQAFPGLHLTLVGAVDEHHNRLRWTWEGTLGDGPAIVGGTDVVTLAPTGKILEVIGFVNFAPEH